MSLAAFALQHSHHDRFVAYLAHRVRALAGRFEDLPPLLVELASIAFAAAGPGARVALTRDDAAAAAAATVEALDEDAGGRATDRAGDEGSSGGREDWLGPKRRSKLKLRVRVCADLSAATYANDAKDGRLKRVLAATVALLEAFDGIPRRLGCEWCLSGFSGELFPEMLRQTLCPCS